MEKNHKHLGIRVEKVLWKNCGFGSSISQCEWVCPERLWAEQERMHVNQASSTVLPAYDANKSRLSNKNMKRVEQKKPGEQPDTTDATPPPHSLPPSARRVG